jgi:5-methylcytosine-specific restriction endonuclease McrA
MLTAKTMLRRLERCAGDPEKVAAEVEAMASEAGAAKRARAAARSRRRARPERAKGSTKAERKATKREADAKVYAEVRDRDAGLCTVQLSPDVLGVCGGALQLDHQWGRGKEPTTVENCRMLCADHHRRKTDSETEQGPSRLLWLCDFREHALSHDYYGEVAKADGKIALERAQHPKAPTVAVRLEVRNG